MVGGLHGIMARRAVTLSGLEPNLVRQLGNGESLYRCPFCEERMGIRDRKGHLYVNPVKGIGHCFRCNTVVVVKDGPLSSIKAAETLAEWLTPPTPKGEDVGKPFKEFREEMEAQGFKPLTIMCGPVVHGYFQERHISMTVAMAAQILYRSDPLPGAILFPFLNPYDLVSVGGYAERSLVDGTWTYSRAGIKNLYFPNAVIARSPYWAFVEGPGDALSLATRGYPGVGIGGTVMSEAQRTQLMYYLPEYIDIFMDTDAAQNMGRLAADISAVYRGKAKTVQQIHLIYAPATKDPAKLMDAELHALLSSEHQILDGGKSAGPIASA